MPQTSGIFPGGPDHLHDGVRVFTVDGIELDYRVRGRFRIALEESLFISMQIDDRQPFLLAVLVAGKGFIDVENTRKIFRPLHVAGKPEAVLGKACKQIIQEPRYPLCRPLARS